VDTPLLWIDALATSLRTAADILRLLRGQSGVFDLRLRKKSSASD